MPHANLPAIRDSTATNTRQSKALAAQRAKPELISRKKFDELTARLEAAKNQSFPKETLEIWFQEMILMGWTDGKFQNRYEAVLQMPQIRRDITFDDFVNAPPASDREVLADAHLLANRIIEIRKEQLRKLKTGEITFQREAEIQGLISLRELYAKEFEHEKETFIEWMRLRADRARKFITHLSDQAVADLYDELITKGMIQPIEDVILRDVGLRWYLRSFIPIASGSGALKRLSDRGRELLQESIRPYLKAEILEIIDVIEKMMNRKPQSSITT